MYSDDEIMHAAMKVLNRREEQLEDELYHYGRKGMKWGKNIFEQEEINKSDRTRVGRQDKRNRRVVNRIENGPEGTPTRNEYDQRMESISKMPAFLQPQYKKHAEDMLQYKDYLKSRGGSRERINEVANLAPKESDNTFNNPYTRASDFVDSKFGKGTAAKVAARYAGQQVGGAIDNAVQTGKDKIVNNPYVKGANYMDSKFGTGTAAKVATNYAGQKANEAAENAGNAINYAVDVGKAKAAETGNKLKEGAAAKKEIFDTKVEDLKEGASNVSQKIGEGASYVGKKIGEGASYVGQKIGEGASEAGEKIKEGARNIIDEHKYKKSVKDADDNSRDALMKIGQAASERYNQNGEFLPYEEETDPAVKKAKEKFEKSLEDAGYEEFYYDFSSVPMGGMPVVYAYKGDEVDQYSHNGYIGSMDRRTFDATDVNLRGNLNSSFKPSDEKKKILKIK